ncbi:hypothetical protein PHYPSEUDO_012848 [Phytophthora pseudosyringae]|uniref:Uncharacterized protein n=1 Tax=Phytophthora pseudosyringae TaxID=221518 RepID=A0A8T1V639_9STRA|nr:hypothetical protein PHYPSEUDO_012848 [Phytophthora pseudosyringae]
MGRQRQASIAVAGADLEWISAFLKTYDGDLLEFELDVDSQHFFDNMDVLLAAHSPNDHRRSPLQLTPFVLSVISGLQDSSTKVEAQEVKPAPSMSFCELLEEAELAAAAKGVPRQQAPRQTVTTPRKSRARMSKSREGTATFSKNYEKPTTRSSSRKKLNRRLFY